MALPAFSRHMQLNAGTDRQTDRQTLYDYTDPAGHTVQAVPITQQFPVKHLQPTD